MKAALYLFISVALTLTACSPRDPEILSEEEKSNRGRSSNASTRVFLPKNLELVMAELVESRQTQVKALLAKAVSLAAISEKVIQNECEKTKLVENTATTKKFRISFPGKCRQQKADVSTSRLGSSEMTLNLDPNGALESFTFTTDSYKDSPLTAFGIQMEKKGANGKKMDLQEEIQLQVLRQADGSFEIQDLKSDSLLSWQEKGKPSFIQIVMILEEALISQEGALLNWTMNTEAIAWPEDGEKTKFGLLLTSKKEDKQVFDFTFHFNGSPRSGTLTFNESEIVAMTKNEKNNKIDKSSRKRTKSEDMAWQIWL